MPAATWHRSSRPAISAREWGRRGTAPIDIAPKRELYIHHTVTSNRRRAGPDERQHMRDLEQVKRP